MSWILGIPFLKKYPFSFNYDNLMIGYLKKNETPFQQNSIFSLYKKEIIILTIFIFSIILAFNIGKYTHKRMSKMPRKSKANELEDNYEYIEDKKVNNNKNRETKNNKINKEIELSSKFINE